MIEKTSVTIFNQLFELSSQTLSPSQLQDLARFVDEQMKKTFKSTNLSSALKIAVLTALNLAQELASLKEQTPENLDKEQYDTATLTQMLLNISKKIQQINNKITLYDDTPSENNKDL
jgi:cell division protein ZapA (FtsZ GTPase activity inhibitor)